MSDIDTVAVDSLKALDPNGPIREADIRLQRNICRYGPIRDQTHRNMIGAKRKTANAAVSPKFGQVF